MKLFGFRFNRLRGFGVTGFRHGVRFGGGFRCLFWLCSLHAGRRFRLDDLLAAPYHRRFDAGFLDRLGLVAEQRGFYLRDGLIVQ